MDPPYVAGHWVPDMVQTAGGDDVLGVGGARSRETTWPEVAAADPDVVILMPCGYPVEKTLQELAVRGRAGRDHPFTRKGSAWFAVDAASYFSRPGPRLVDGVELLADILHPQAGRPLDPARAVPVDPVLALGMPA
jgi:iron complex transport system substrate-binding protein